MLNFGHFREFSDKVRKTFLLLPILESFVKETWLRSQQLHAQS